MKQGIRAVGIDDGPQAGRTLLVGVVMRPDRIEGILSTRVVLDGYDSTRKIASMLSSRFRPQVKCVFLDGVAVAGFNLIDYPKLAATLGLPVIVCTSNKPHPADFEKALERWPRKQKLWQRVRTPAYRLGSVWYQFSGCTQQEAAELIGRFQVHSAVPEPLRVAHLVAAGLELGESRGL
jgi:uncharacterized protein